MNAKIILAVLAVSALPLQAQSLYEKVKPTEISLETYGAYSVARGPFEDLLKHGLGGGTFGTGIAINTFFGEYVGVKLDSTINAAGEISGGFIDYSSASFVLRFPINIKLNPYALAGIGRNWDTERWNTHVGVGVAYALTERVGATAEFRHVFESRAEDYDQIRFGLSYKF